ncbi:MAG TPA: YciI family protein [Microlunatus sp.]
MPQYLIAFNDEWVPDFTPEEIAEKSLAVQAVSSEMKTAGVFLFENGGIDASTVVASVEAKDGEPVFTDGPYVETKEHLGGFCVVDLLDDDAAKYWAGRIAVALDWPQEIHRFPEMGHHREETDRER